MAVARPRKALLTPRIIIRVLRVALPFLRLVHQGLPLVTVAEAPAVVRRHARDVLLAQLIVHRQRLRWTVAEIVVELERRRQGRVVHYRPQFALVHRWVTIHAEILVRVQQLRRALLQVRRPLVRRQEVL
jgi:hypothetical protein